MYNKAYYESHRELFRATQHRYETSPAGRAARQATNERYRITHPDRIREYNRKKNAEQKEYRRLHPQPMGRPPQSWQPIAGYKAAHGRVIAINGPAKNHHCVDCDGPAKDWSYDHSDPNELVSAVDDGFGCVYSLQPDHYEPRCKKCHKQFDGAAV